ncbi:hypothetical protein JTB14_003600 [Gonioctena quinquepunctata]|nr:hypothetical protein JTB14_003600 [Gonioctena quinquepunctata]
MRHVVKKIVNQQEGHEFGTDIFSLKQVSLAFLFHSHSVARFRQVSVRSIAERREFGGVTRIGEPSLRTTEFRFYLHCELTHCAHQKNTCSKHSTFSCEGRHGTSTGKLGSLFWSEYKFDACHSPDKSGFIGEHDRIQNSSDERKGSLAQYCRRTWS